MNVKLFLIAEVFILVLAMFLAVMRSLPGPVFFPIRALAVGYIDLFRGIPTVLVIYTLGFGAPALGESVPEVPVLLGAWSPWCSSIPRTSRRYIGRASNRSTKARARRPVRSASPAGSPCAS